ncbi:flavin-containing monooxygenase FMO GS-OX4-like [Sphaerodactylus townsendi]|uniref:flavin-containing monooxygenase FMO GS-OX4-like n=1 Tax=Sphaerodactylus townsendi TaxID=933632 RepID=UPI0020266CB2|nr:flavin-containing monooxygenase FMO GS-OX4-like [Sphaerodactylus townsendi]XP_048375340.1 flavin-containing monooxygenase FMO GS-OX4-like [Sphaerodactylus townsendi]
MASKKLRVAVIGAGAAGLCAARHILACPDAFLPPVVFEASDQVGGTWVYTEQTGEDAEGWPIHSSMYRDLRTNLPKEVMAFPDFPFDPSLPSFLHHSDVLAYLESYREESGIQDHVRFRWQVDDVRPVLGDQGWDIRATVRGSGSTHRVSEHFDAVMVCTGHYSVPYIPPIPGLDSFQGCLLHSHSYRCTEPFAGLTVLLVGAGASGVDLALQLSPVAARVVLSHHGPPVCGLPEDVLQVPRLLKVAKETVEFRDGSVLQPDVLIFCTGYRYCFPFLPLAQLGLQETDYGVGPLHRHLLAPRHPSLFFIGLCQLICPFPHFHCQVLFALAVLQGRCRLPSAAEMEADAQEQLERYLREGGLARHFLKLKAQQWSYAKELAHLAGFPPLPPAVQAIYEATRARRCHNVSTYRDTKYHLLGPDAWEEVQDSGTDLEDNRKAE